MRETINTIKDIHSNASYRYPIHHCHFLILHTKGINELYKEWKVKYLGEDNNLSLGFTVILVVCDQYVELHEKRTMKLLHFD